MYYYASPTLIVHKIDDKSFLSQGKGSGDGGGGGGCETSCQRVLVFGRETKSTKVAFLLVMYIKWSTENITNYAMRIGVLSAVNIASSFRYTVAK